MTRILITGATGFIGSNLVRACLSRGHSVGALVLPDDRAVLPEGVTRFPGTLEQPPWDAIEAFEPEVCVHAAWVTTPGAYMTSPLNGQFEQWSMAFLSHLFERSVRRIIGVGTCIEYVPDDSEQAAAPYVQSKRRLRLWLERDTRTRGVASVWGRIFFPYGVGEPEGKLCRTIIETLMRGESFPIYSPDAVRDYVAVSDVARGLALLAESTVTGDVDVGSGLPVTIREIGCCVADILGRDARECFEWGDRPDGLVLPVADTARLNALGWMPELSLRQGIEALVESRREDKGHG